MKFTANKALLSDKFFAALQICRRARRYAAYVNMRKKWKKNTRFMLFIFCQFYCQ